MNMASPRRLEQAGHSGPGGRHHVDFPVTTAAVLAKCRAADLYRAGPVLRVDDEYARGTDNDMIDVGRLTPWPTEVIEHLVPG